MGVELGKVEPEHGLSGVAPPQGGDGLAAWDLVDVSEQNLFTE